MLCPDKVRLSVLFDNTFIFAVFNETSVLDGARYTGRPLGAWWNRLQWIMKPSGISFQNANKNPVSPTWFTWVCGNEALLTDLHMHLQTVMSSYYRAVWMMQLPLGHTYWLLLNKVMSVLIVLVVFVLLQWLNKLSPVCWTPFWQIYSRLLSLMVCKFNIWIHHYFSLFHICPSNSIKLKALCIFLSHKRDPKFFCQSRSPICSESNMTCITR